MQDWERDRWDTAELPILQMVFRHRPNLRRLEPTLEGRRAVSAGRAIFERPSRCLMMGIFM